MHRPLNIYTIEWLKSMFQSLSKIITPSNIVRENSDIVYKLHFVEM